MNEANISMEEEGDNQRECSLFKISSKFLVIIHNSSLLCPTSIHALSDPIGQLVRTSSSHLLGQRAGFILLEVNIVTTHYNQP